MLTRIRMGLNEGMDWVSGLSGATMRLRPPHVTASGPTVDGTIAQTGPEKSHHVIRDWAAAVGHPPYQRQKRP